MIKESGRIIAVADDHLWLQTTQKSTCDSCRGRQVCGQRLLQNLSERQGLLKVPLEDRLADQFQLADSVTIGIEESTLLRATAIAYVVPLVSLLLLSALGQYWLGELGAIAGAATGLALGALWGRYRLAGQRCNARYQPRLVD